MSYSLNVVAKYIRSLSFSDMQELARQLCKESESVNVDFMDPIAVAIWLDSWAENAIKAAEGE